MRHLLLIGLTGLACLAGCSSTHHSLVSRQKERADDPMLTPAEQQRRVRASYAYPDEQLGPRYGVQRPPDAPHNQ